MGSFCAALASVSLSAIVIATPAAGQAAGNAPVAATESAEPQAAPADNQLSDIVVTANKRQERLIDTPQTINVVNGDQLEKFNATRFEDLQRFVPGLEVDNGGKRTVSVSLRGVAYDPDSQTNSTVDIYLDEVPFDPAQAVQAQFDVGSIQVLRGPQGTLRGGTGPSGAILVGTRQPNLQRIEMNGSGSYSDRGAVNLQAGVSIPLIADKLAVRVAGLYDWNPVNGVRDIANGQKDFNRSYGGRISLLFQPVPNLNFLIVHQEFRARNNQLMAMVSDPSAPVGRFGQLGVEDRAAVSLGPIEQQTNGRATILNATWDVAGNRLTYLGSYQDNDSNQTADLNYANSLTPSFLNFVVPGLGNYAYQQYQNIRVNTRRFTNELRLERTGNHFWIYRFGTYFDDSESRLGGVIDYTGANGSCRTARGPLAIIGLPCIDLGGGVIPKSHTRGFFSTQTFNFTSRDTLDLGLRYTTAHVDNPPYDTRYKAWTGSASYKHEFGPGLIAYANYGRSFRPGGFDSSGFNNSAGANAIPASVFYWKPERSDAVEVGFKGELLGRRFTYAVSGFYQKFDNFINRVNSIACTGNPAGIGPLPGTVYTTSNGGVPTGGNACGNTGVVNLTYNAPASVRGVELDLRGQIMRGWTGQITAAYADAHYDNAEIPCNDYNGDGIPDQVGTPAVQAGRIYSLCRSSGQLSSLPKFQATFNTEYRFALPDGFHAYVRGIGRYLGPADIATTGQHIPSKFKVDGFAGIETPVGVEVGMFVRNLFDQRVDVVSNAQMYDLFGAPTGYRTVTYDQRREFGLLMRMNF